MSRRSIKGRRCSFESLEDRGSWRVTSRPKWYVAIWSSRATRTTTRFRLRATQVIGVGTTINGGTTPFNITGFTVR